MRDDALAALMMQLADRALDPAGDARPAGDAVLEAALRAVEAADPGNLQRLTTALDHRKVRLGRVTVQ